MKKGFVLGLSVLALGVLGACGSSSDEASEEKIIKVASQTTPMTDVVKVAAEAVEDGWEIQLVQVNDNIQYNELLNNDEQAWDTLVDEFDGYRQVWLKRGVMPMLRAEPAMVRIAASISAAVRSGILVLAISSH